MVAEIEPSPAALVERASEQPTQRKAGRPTLYSPEMAAIVIGYVRSGDALSRACARAGLHSGTGANWCDAFPDFSDSVAQAEAEHVADLRASMLACTTKWGTPDPKGLELACRRFPEFRQHQESTITSTNLNLNLTAPVSEDQLAKLQGMRLSSLANDR